MQENTINSANQAESQNGQTIDLKAIFYLFLSHWYWFLISAVLAFGFATYYLKKAVPVYTRSAKLLVKSEEKGKSVFGASGFQDMGIFGTSVNITNELQTIYTIDNIREVVQRLHLDMNYTVDGRFHKHLLYDQTLPVTVDLLGGLENTGASFDLHHTANKELRITNFVLDGIEKTGEVVAKLGDTVTTPIGPMCVRPTDYYEKIENYDLIHVHHFGLESAARYYKGKLHVSRSDKQSDVINLVMNDISQRRADDFINMLIAVYNNNWLKDKNQIMVSTSLFIDDRLQLIEQELGDVDSDISTYKSKNLLPDVNAVSNIYLNQNTSTSNRIIELNNQISITRYIRNILVSDLAKDQLLPVNTGVNSPNIESQISTYNSMMLRRNSLVANSSEENPLVLDLDENLSSMRQAIISSIDNMLVTLNNQLASLQGTERMINQRLADSPGQAKYLLSVERQQKVKESLYLFLLQKREENQLSQAFTAYNSRVIEQPNGSALPTKPKPSMIKLIALILGLAIPGVILFLKEQFNTTIRGRKDLEKLSIPLVGEIPLAYSKADQKKKKKEAKKKRAEQQDQEIKEGFAGGVVVKEGSRNVINEAFRVFRTNLEFMSKDKDSNIFMFTSFNPGSGKSFITINTAITLAIKKKKVLVIDGDLRHASLSAYIFSPKKGIANYLAHQEEDINQLILHSNDYPTLDYLPVGTIPPNPTELLENDFFGDLIAGFGKEYDYVLIDCPPIDIVADPQIVNKYVDRTIFVVREGLMERSLVPELENIYTQQRFKNMSLVLNGSTGNDGRYGYGSRYGYRYGYRYGGKYGYHSGYYGHNKKGASYYHEDEE